MTTTQKAKSLIIQGEQVAVVSVGNYDEALDGYRCTVQDASRNQRQVYISARTLVSA